jgi:hypothetical protein
MTTALTELYSILIKKFHLPFWVSSSGNYDRKLFFKTKLSCRSGIMVILPGELLISIMNNIFFLRLVNFIVVRFAIRPPVLVIGP